MIYLVLLVSWLGMSQEPLDFVEFYAGSARLAQMAAGMGYRAEAYDLDFGRVRAERKGKRSGMDINSNAGFMLLVPELWDFRAFVVHQAGLPFMCVYTYYIYRVY